MPASSFVSVLRDVATLASTAVDDVSSQSLKIAAAADDIAVLTGQAAAKTAGVAGDDLAVGVGQVRGISPQRELPALWRIAKASLLNKLWLAGLLLTVSYMHPPAITAALVAGGLYLAYEGGESLLEYFHPHEAEHKGPALTEDQKVRSAIRTDLVLSLEILVITLAATGEVPLAYKAGVLAAMSVIMTGAIYGIIALLIRLDDMGLALTRRSSPVCKSMGQKLIKAAPVILRALGPIGMLAMFAVAGGIFTHMLHVVYPHWALGLAGDIAVGSGLGLALAGAHSVGARIFRKLRGR